MFGPRVDEPIPEAKVITNTTIKLPSKNEIETIARAAVATDFSQHFAHKQQMTKLHEEGALFDRRSPQWARGEEYDPGSSSNSDSSGSGSGGSAGAKLAKLGRVRVEVDHYQEAWKWKLSELGNYGVFASMATGSALAVIAAYIGRQPRFLLFVLPFMGLGAVSWNSVEDSWGRQRFVLNAMKLRQQRNAVQQLPEPYAGEGGDPDDDGEGY